MGDDYAPACPYPSYIVYETLMLSNPYMADTLNFWNGAMLGYWGALLTTLVVVAILTRLRPRGGARP